MPVEYTQEQKAFFRTLIRYLKALNEEVLTDEHYMRARYLFGPARANIEREHARAGKAFLTLPNGKRAYRPIKELNKTDVRDLMREIETNNSVGGEHMERQPLTEDVGMVTFREPDSGRVAISLEYRAPKPPPEAPKSDHLFYEVLVGWNKLKHERWGGK